MNCGKPVITADTPDNTALAIPDHILFGIIENFVDDSLSSMGKMAQVCRDYHNSLSDPSLWNLKLYDRFDTHFFHPLYTPMSPVDPKKVYQATHMLEKCFTRGLFHGKLNFRTSNSIITAIRIHNGSLVVGGSDGSVKFVPIPDATDCPFVTIPEPSNAHSSASGVTCLAPVGAEIVSGHADGSLTVHKSGSLNQISHQISEASPVSSISAVSDSVVFSSTHRLIQLYDLEQQKPILTKRTDIVPNSVSARGSSGVVGSRDKKARIIDFRSGDYVTSISMANWCLCVEASDTADHILRASDRAVKTFDLRSPNHPVDTRHATNRLISQFKSDSKLRLVSCGLDGQVLVSSLEAHNKSEPPQTVHECEDYILTLDFDRTRLACGGINGKYNLFTF